MDLVCSVVLALDVQVKDLTPDSRGHNLVVRVVSIDAVQEKTRFDGTTSRIAEAVVGDETGIVTLTARNGKRERGEKPINNGAKDSNDDISGCVYADQIALLQEGEAIVIRNCSADVFNGFVRVNVSMWGKLSKHPDGVASTPPCPATVNQSNNISGVEYELVTVEDTGDE